MPCPNRTQIKNSLGDVIHTLSKTEETHESPAKNLPPVFGNTAAHIPLVQAVFASCKNHVKTWSSQDDESAEDVSRILIQCNKKVTRLDEIFQNVTDSSDAVQQYSRVAHGVGLEVLMRDILSNTIELARSPVFATAPVLRSQIEELQEALRKVHMIPSSLPKASHQFHNSGSGSMNVNTGGGSQNNNTGKGFQFNGPVNGLNIARNGE
ncbi:hypothetical protein N7533_008622 [Penicillium manginii]|uniref:uncharacterized protein n=1 Tax=Penicillium manginii TaxID=203109 RepID=UPI00254982C4|nr:uncharacterized protein N7533_008622 [Penicillium manginii]KAJ5743752.1 hypothetical protein N7533_008622 [Penicillium manginii]